MFFSHNNHLFKKIFCFHVPILKLSFKSWNVVFFGSDDFSLVSLKTLHKFLDTKLINNLEVVTLNNNNSIYEYAFTNNLKINYWPPALKDKFDFGVVVSFGKLIPMEVICHFPLGIINIHASLLPRWRGPAPIFHAIKNGDTISGVTIITINQQFDTGDIIMKRSCSIGENEMLPSIYKKLSKLGAECLSEVIKEMPECLEKKFSQPNQNISYAPKLKKEISIIKWNEMNSVQVYNLFRALCGVFDLKTTWQGIPVQLLCLSLDNSIDNIQSQFNREGQNTPGSIKYCKKKNCLIVQCKDNSSVKVCTTKMRGKLYLAEKFNQGFLTQVPKEFHKFIS